MQRPVFENQVSEEEKRAHTTEAQNIANWCEYSVPWKEKELNMAPFQRKIDVYDNLWGIDMRILMDHLIERNGIIESLDIFLRCVRTLLVNLEH